MYSKW